MLAEQVHAFFTTSSFVLSYLNGEWTLGYQLWRFARFAVFSERAKNEFILFSDSPSIIGKRPYAA